MTWTEPRSPGPLANARPSLMSRVLANGPGDRV